MIVPPRFGCLLLTSLLGFVPANLVAQNGLDALRAHAVADSNDPVAHYHLAAALYTAKRYDDAERSLREAVRIDPQYAPALYLLARVNERRAGPMRALIGFRRILFIRSDPRADETALLRRRAFLLDPLLEVEPPSREWLPVAWRGTLGRALHHYDRREWGDAIMGFQTVIDRTRGRDSTQVPPVALWFRMRCALHLGDYDAALSYLDWLLKLRMQDSTTERVWNPFAGDEVRYIIAYVYKQARRWEEAIAAYQDVASTNLGLDAAHTHLADIYEAQERWPEAVQERVRAFHANPDATSLIFNLGVTLATVGRFEEAEALLERYSAHYPRESRVYYLLGVARAALADTGGARDALTRYLAMAPSRYKPQIDDARQRLAALGDARAQEDSQWH